MTETDPAADLPSAANEFAKEYPEVWEAYSELGKSSSEAGPIDGETKRLVKLSIAIAAQSEGAVHSHVRRGLDEGLEQETLKHAAVLAVPTIGFPQAMAAMTWIEDITDEE